MTSFSISDALATLITAIPGWATSLDSLHGQMSKRQTELARLMEERRQTTRASLRNRGSTESLRPNDESAEKLKCSNDIAASPAPVSMALRDDFAPEALQSSRPAAIENHPSKVEEEAILNVRPHISPVIRNCSEPLSLAQTYIKPAITKKRKTDSLASTDPNLPKYRTRSMIIVYYDSAVQTAFEELVKFISSSRNNMRKGKMALKMAEMEKVAEIENDDDNDINGDQLLAKLRRGYRSSREINAMQDGRVLVTKSTEQDIDTEAAQDDDHAMVKLKFVSTRQMRPPRAPPFKSNQNTALSNLGSLRGGYRRGEIAAGTLPDVLDDLDKKLEWCQGQCEHAAHQFLRDGECGPEIEGIKSTLAEVVTRAEAEIEHLKTEQSCIQYTSPSPLIPSEGTPQPEGKSRNLKSIHVRREVTPSPRVKKQAESDDMDVDEGVEDLESPPAYLSKEFIA